MVSNPVSSSCRQNHALKISTNHFSSTIHFYIFYNFKLRKSTNFYPQNITICDRGFLFWLKRLIYQSFICFRSNCFPPIKKTLLGSNMRSKRSNKSPNFLNRFKLTKRFCETLSKMLDFIEIEVNSQTVRKNRKSLKTTLKNIFQEHLLFCKAVTAHQT